MSENTYAVAAGIVQFDVEEKDITVDGEDVTITELTIKTFTQQKLVRITLFPEFEGVEVKKGDTVFVDGKVRVSLGQEAEDGSQKEYIGITATQISVVPGFEKAPRDDAPKRASSAKKKSSSDTPLF